jgi:hypothetical protein
MSTKVLKKQKFLTARLNDNLKDITDLKERIAEGIDVDFNIKWIYEIYEESVELRHEYNLLKLLSELKIEVS